MGVVNLLCLFLPPSITLQLAVCIGVMTAPAFTGSHPVGWDPPGVIEPRRRTH